MLSIKNISEKIIDNHIRIYYETSEQIKILEDKKENSKNYIIDYMKQNDLVVYKNKNYKVKKTIQKNSAINPYLLCKMINIENFMLCVKVIKKECEKYLNKKQIDCISEKKDGATIIYIRKNK